MKLLVLFMIGLLFGFFTVLLLPLLFVIALQRFIVSTREPHIPYRCAGDLIVSEMGGHNVEMFRWIK